MKSKIQTCGSYCPETDYTFSICFGDGPLMTLEGLSKEDIIEIASCSLCMLPDEDYKKLVNSRSN